MKKYWTNDQGLKAEIGFCPYHPKTRLDGAGECDKCLNEIINYTKRRK
jgi:hypothetical protein